MTFAPLGDSAVVITLGPGLDDATLLKVRSLTAALEQESESGVLEAVPAYHTVTVFYDPAAFASNGEAPYDRVCRHIAEAAGRAENAWPDLVSLPDGTGQGARGTLEIPVCYGGEFGPDLEDVARHCGLTSEEVVARHSGASYVVHAVGFSPGFPYLGGLPPELETPRRATPRVRVAAGSVGIGGRQTGVYSLESPGGWQLIGRTPIALFDPSRTPAARLRAGDRVSFRRIGPEEFVAWR